MKRQYVGWPTYTDAGGGVGAARASPSLLDTISWTGTRPRACGARHIAGQLTWPSTGSLAVGAKVLIMTSSNERARSRHVVRASVSNVLALCTVSSEMYDNILDVVKDRRWRTRR
jgi:hypothetical protein